MTLSAILTLTAAAAISSRNHPQMVPPAADNAPSISREFRGAWIATVANIDWPSKRGLTTQQQQDELVSMLDRAVNLHMNAVILQVRPACDALYDSPFEPWSEYLTGHMGQAPNPYYDPLAFAVTQAHQRGLELHAWFNPFRARMPEDAASSPASANHVSSSHPAWVKSYGKFQWLDPGQPEVQAHSLKVILDVVKRYDIDGVHLDDYFYPYREPLYKVSRRTGFSKTAYQAFPDDATFEKYRAAGGNLNLADWRRENVNHFIQSLYLGVKESKPWVKVGLSPFGIWKPGHPKQIKGMSQYDSIYADARLWLRSGWCDYFTPQLYWPIETPEQSFPVLLDWWTKQNFKGRHVWPGLFTSRIADDSGAPWDARQVVNQILWTRLNAAASGHVHFSFKALNANRGGIGDKLVEKPYADVALVPPSPWLDAIAPLKPEVNFERDPKRAVLTASWHSPDRTQPWLWTIYLERGKSWSTQVLPAGTNRLELDFNSAQSAPHALEIAAVDRCGNESEHARFVFGTTEPSVTNTKK